MRGGGFEPPKALSHRILSPARLTAPEPSHKELNNHQFKNYSAYQNPFIHITISEYMADDRVGVIGFDECGVKEYPVVYTAAFSNNIADADTKPPRGVKLYSKKNPGRANASNPPEFIDDLDYRWLQFDTEHRSQLEPHYRWGAIIPSLLYGVRVTSPLILCIDGHQTSTTLDRIRGSMRDLCGITGDDLIIRHDRDYDKRVRVVNWAHHLAYHIKYRQTSIDELGRDPHRRQLRQEFFPRTRSKRKKR